MHAQSFTRAECMRVSRQQSAATLRAVAWTRVEPFRLSESKHLPRHNPQLEHSSISVGHTSLPSVVQLKSRVPNRGAHEWHHVRLCQFYSTQ